MNRKFSMDQMFKIKMFKMIKGNVNRKRIRITNQKVNYKPNLKAK